MQKEIWQNHEKIERKSDRWEKEEEDTFFLGN